MATPAGNPGPCRILQGLHHVFTELRTDKGSDHQETHEDGLAGGKFFSPQVPLNRTVSLIYLLYM
jgi:hypothetical protein